MVHRFLARAVAFVVIAVLVAGCGGGLKNEYHREMEDRYPDLADLQLEMAERTRKSYLGGSTQTNKISMSFAFDQSVYSAEEVLEEITDKAEASGLDMIRLDGYYPEWCASVPSTIGEYDLVFSASRSANDEQSIYVTFTYGGGALCR